MAREALGGGFPYFFFRTLANLHLYLPCSWLNKDLHNVSKARGCYLIRIHFVLFHIHLVAHDLRSGCPITDDRAA